MIWTRLIHTVGKYLIEALKAAGMDLSMWSLSGHRKKSQTMPKITGY